MNQDVKDYFDDIVKLSQVFEKLGCSCEIHPPATEQEIAGWEKEIGHSLPSDYRDLLKLSKYIYMSRGFVQLHEPVLCGENEIYIGLVIGDGDDYYYDFQNQQFYREFEGEINLFDSFSGLLDNVYCELEMSLDSEFGDRWTAIYDELFPDE
ncbi:MAG: SMI1/KNR4 family protein [Oscillospiraceae bacterium]